MLGWVGTLINKSRLEQRRSGHGAERKTGYAAVRVLGGCWDGTGWYQLVFSAGSLGPEMEMICEGQLVG